MSKLRQNMYQKQTQSLLLKPKMLQSLEMLAMPLLELEIHLKQEMIDNPLLELLDARDEDEPEEAEETEEYSEDKAEKPEEADPDITSDEELQKTLAETQELSEILDSYNEYYDDMSYRQESTERMNFDQVLRVREDPKEDFFQQLDQVLLTDDEYDLAYELIDSVNDYGFLPPGFSLYNLAAEYQIDEDRADEIHQIILHFDPPGITARTIQECLVAQLDEQDDTENLIRLVKENFDDLIHKRYKRIASKFGVALKTIYQWKYEISRLDPKPGLRLLSNLENYIIPDVILKKIDNDYEIIINDFSFPKIRMSGRYREILRSVKQDREAVQYVRNKINSAKFLIKSIYLRGRTLERVMKSIIRNQMDFFYGNSGVLKPLTYSVIAEELQVNESTISRVVRSKYADTPFGIICLKDFFTSRAGKDKDYNSVSRQNVETQIRKMIDSEDPLEPISDQDIAEKFKHNGINVSRRVVAKYRKAMGILNSHLRRKV
ncbi:MAG: RNA polymerase factor sigma-54 [Candidatus Cloacimonetes bacterium]|nr:RNA polymerase factor sigma-54 [Candidatus Cloacimonadota bacterium]